LIGIIVSDWVKIEIAEFMALVGQDTRPSQLVGRIILERLPFAFDTKEQYFNWRDMLAEGLEVDARDIIIVGSAATGRSLNSRTQFGVFNKHSDVDIAIISQVHFDRAWQWFRQADPVLLGFQEVQRRLFDRHREGYVFDGMIAANSFLSYLPFGSDWNRELQRSERYLPPILQGRVLSVRIYRDSEALRRAQLKSLISYQTYLRSKRENSSGEE
jgi:hypothetical protein